MTVTVRDCLELPIFQEAEVVGGVSGLNHVVKAVSVIETTDLNEMLADLMQGNEIVITALFNARDDVSKQCNVIRMLKRGKEAAIVLFYVGLIVPKIHKELIDTANEVGLPLICMPQMRSDLSYADTISAIMELIIQDRMYATQFINEIISEFSRVRMVEQQNLQHVLNLMAKKLECGLAIFDQNLDMLLISNVPEQIYLAINEKLKASIREDSYILHRYGKINIDYNDRNITVHTRPTQIERNKQMYLFIIDQKNKFNSITIGQINETIKLCASIWRYNPIEEVESSLVEAILFKDNMMINLLSNKLKIDMAVYGLAVLEPCLRSVTPTDRNKTLETLKLHLRNCPLRTLTFDNSDNIVIILMKPSKYNNDEISKAMAVLQGKIEDICYPSMVSIWSLNLSGHEQVSNEYKKIIKASQAAQKIYPHKRNLSKHEITFAAHCLTLLELSDEEKKLIKLLEPLNEYDSVHSGMMLETLATFLLDADLNLNKAAEIMYLHPNSVKYRIKKIEAILGGEMTCEPFTLMLSIALATYRVLQDS